MNAPKKLHIWETDPITPPSKATNVTGDPTEGLRLYHEAERMKLEREKLKHSMSDDGPQGGSRELLSRSLDTVQMRAIDWLWTGWIPKGYITI